MTCGININNNSIPNNNPQSEEATLGGRVYAVFKNIYDFVTSKVFLITVLALACLAALVYVYIIYQAKQCNSPPIKPFNLQAFVENPAVEMAGLMAMLASLDRMPTKQMEDSDLLIFPPNYKQPMPLNGVREAEFEKLKMVLPEKLFNIVGTDSFKKQVRGLLRLLITRPAGRELMLALQARAPFNLTIQEDLKESHLTTSLKGAVVALQLIPDHNKHTRNAQSKNKFINDSNDTLSQAMTLAHELIHFLHYLKEGVLLKGKPSIDDNYSNREEQQTICGWGTQLLPLATATQEEVEKLASASQEELDALFRETIKVDYDFINENRLRAEFNLEHRVNHYGTTTPKSLKIDPHYEVSAELSRYVYSLIGNQFEIDFEKFLIVNKEVDLATVKVAGRPFLNKMMEAILHNTEATSKSIENLFPIVMKHAQKISLRDKFYCGELIGLCKVLSAETKLSLISQLVCK